MAEKPVDALTGTETTGHEWDGIRELNTPLPRWWLWVFYATIAWSIVYFVLYPAWPLGVSGYTKGVLGYSSRQEHRQDLEAQREGRAGWLARFEEASVDEIAADPDLLQFAMAGGRVIFADNCAPCHGAGGGGAPSYPVLVDDDWIWGGTLEDIHATIQYGVRSEHPDTRFAEMPAFGRDELLTAEEITAVTDYVLWLAGGSEASETGKTVFEDNCVVCHGDDGKGIAELGSPNLTDSIWLYGDSRDAIVAQINAPTHGVMPPWIDRLDPASVKQVTVFVHSLGGGQ